VVLDIGSMYSRCGFAGESVPRRIFATSLIDQSGKKVLQFFLSLSLLRIAYSHNCPVHPLTSPPLVPSPPPSSPLLPLLRFCNILTCEQLSLLSFLGTHSESRSDWLEAVENLLHEIYFLYVYIIYLPFLCESPNLLQIFTM
jgi:hypothetical protein